MNNSYVLGICGHAGAGKDMVADYLVKELSFVRIAFALPIKQMASEYFFVNGDDLQRSDKPEKVRKLLQMLGTEVGRAYDPDIWVEHMIVNILNAPFDRIIVTDVRFPNEAEMLVKKFNADLIFIRRPLNPNIGARMMEHASETSIEQIPFDLFRTAFVNPEGRQEEMLKEILLNVKGWLECHSSRKTPK